MASMREIEERMARTKQSQRPAGFRPEFSGGRQPSRLSVMILSVSVLAAFWAVAMLTSAGRVVYIYAFFFLDFFAGVLSLVALSITVMIGLLATDRMVLVARHRVLLQSGHRTTGLMAIGALVLHVFTQISTGAVSAIGAFVPFVGGQEGLYVSFGTVAACLMVGVAWTGIIRARFVNLGKPWIWRALHGAAYVTWPIAILHGISAGRPPALWVMLSYLACVLLVALALLIRLSMGFTRRKAWTTQAGSIKPVGQMAPADSARISSAQRRGRRDDGISREPTAARFGDLGGRAPDMIDSRETVGVARTGGSSGRRSDRYRIPEVPRPRSTESRPAQTRAPRRFDDDGAEPQSSGRDRYADDGGVRDRVRDDDGPRERYTDDRRGRPRYADEDAGRGYVEDDGDQSYADGGGRGSPREEFRPPDRYDRPDDRPEPVSGPRGRFDAGGPEPVSGPRGRFGGDRPVSPPVARGRVRPRRGADESIDDVRPTTGGDSLPDETPTLVDLAARRAMRTATAESAPRRGFRRGRSNADDLEEAYRTQLRGEAN